MRHYETTCILRPSLGEEQCGEVIERLSSIIKKDSGTIIALERWGLKRLTYHIKKESQGHYVHLNYAAPGGTVHEIERICRIDDRVLRYLTVKTGEAIDEAGIEQERERIAARAAAKAKEEAEQNKGAAGGEDDEANNDADAEEQA